MGARSLVIDTTGLVKDFGRTRALNGLDLQVAEGEIHGFLGPNGAGKSTTLRILLGLVRPSSGTVRVFGLDPWRQPVPVHRDIGYVPGDVSLWPNLTGGEVIDLLTGLRSGAEERIRRELIEEFGLDPTRKTRTYSKGNRQKVALIAAFARPARLYVLDEPGSGLDPLMEAALRRRIRLARDEGAAVLLSSHILSEVEALCDSVTIIRSGAAVESGSLAGLRHLHRTHFRATGLANPEALRDLNGLQNLKTADGAVEFETEPADLARVLSVVAAAGPAGLEISPPSLESLFLRHYQERLPR